MRRSPGNAFPNDSRMDRELSSRASITSRSSFVSRLNYDDFSDDESKNPDDPNSSPHFQLFDIIEGGMALLNTGKEKNKNNRPMTSVEESQRNKTVEATWKKIRAWLWKHPDPQVRAKAMSVRGKDDATSLHNVCQLPNQPDDIIQDLVDASSDSSVTWKDSHGWFPLHHACAHSASGKVIKILIDAFPQGATKQDTHARTPLHFYLIQCTENSASMVNNVRHLSSTGAAKLPDMYGMLPMHYACAYSVSPPVLAVLKEAYPESMTAKEGKGRTPMHLALANAHRDASPSVTKFLLENSDASEIVNERDLEGYLPLHLMPLGLRHFKADEPNQINNVSECLKMYLAAEPEATADFLTALQDLPDWLKDVAVVTSHVRNILNEKIVRRFPTFMLFFEFFVYIMIIIVFERTSERLITSMFTDWSDKTFDRKTFNSENYVVVLWIGATYFLLRELIQIVSLWSLGSISRWFKDPYNWLDVTIIVVIYYFSLLMTLAHDDFLKGDRPLDMQFFTITCEDTRSFAAFTLFILWIAVVSFLRTTLVDFAIFVGGVAYVTKRLGAFFLAVIVILIMFAQIFYFLYLKTETCNENSAFPHCNFYDSFVKVITMVMGEIGNEGRYDDNIIAQWVYMSYAVIVVILLSNILIAIVTESYEVIQNDRAASVFWGNRLDIVAEMDAISYGVLRRLPNILGNTVVRDETEDKEDRSQARKGCFYHAWKNIMELFDDNRDGTNENEFSPRNIEFWCYLIFQVAAVTVIIPLWLVCGLVTFGILWPPQIREFILVQREASVSRSDMEKQKLEQLKRIETNLKNIKTDLKKEILTDREEIVRMKNEVQSTQNDIMADLKEVRELMQTLLEFGRETATAAAESRNLV